MWNKPRLLNWIAHGLFALAAVLMVYAALFVVIRLPVFPLREVRVEGELHYVTREQVELVVSRYLRGNFFTVQLERSRDAFRKLPWVRNVSVRRRWPDTLEVTLEEHQALARWGSIALVNTHGELFMAASDADLPVFYGPGNGVHEMAEHFARYRALLAPTRLEIAEVRLSPRRAWQIGTDGGTVIALGCDRMEERLRKFAGAYDKTLGLLNARVTYVDLRYLNGFAVQRPAGKGSQKRGAG